MVERIQDVLGQSADLVIATDESPVAMTELRLVSAAAVVSSGNKEAWA
jgi:hypothetical protein